MFRPFTELDVGFSNAENYKRRENKALLNKYFVRDDYLEKVLNPNVFFLVGEKGTGKTAYATYLKNNKYKGYEISSYDVRQTEYLKFLELKKSGHLPLSQYAEVWRTLLLIMAATSILENSDTNELVRRFTKLAGLKKVIEEFYDNAFAPEIVKIINFIESSELASSIMAKYLPFKADLASKITSETRDSTSIFQTHLLKLRQSFEGIISSIKLEKNSIIFIDGIDIRPQDISYGDYFDCVRGLIEAVWYINNDFLANIKGSPGHIKVVLLVRPDIFLRAGLHNQNTKLRDNSVFLNWATTYKDYRGSMLFRVADRLLSAQQVGDPGGEQSKLGVCWDRYFPFHAENVRASGVSGEKGVNSFLAFMRFSYYRPRDISAMISTMKDIIQRNRGYADYVTAEDFNDPSFRDAHADYLLGEIRDQLLFYYSQDEFDLFLQFFAYLKGKIKFKYNEFLDSFNDFIGDCNERQTTMPQFFETADGFLQFLYDQNIICFIENDAKDGSKKERFIRWCFRERTLSNMAPKVRVGAEYEIFYGLGKALNVGRPVRIKREPKTRLIGTIIKLQREAGFGFIRGGEKQLEYYFKLEEFGGDPNYLKISQKVSFEASVKYAKPRASKIQREK